MHTIVTKKQEKRKAVKERKTMMAADDESISLGDGTDQSVDEEEVVVARPPQSLVGQIAIFDEHSHDDHDTYTSLESEHDTYMEGLMEVVSMYLARDERPDAEGDGCDDDDDERGSIGGKTNQTNTTDSTESLSQNLSLSFVTDDHLVIDEERSSYEVELIPPPPQSPPQQTQPQQLTRTLIASSRNRAGYANLSSNFNSFEDDLSLVEASEPIVVLGIDISHLSPKMQFLVCASGVFGFSLLYGYLQELISVQILNRQLGLFLSMMQFTGYTILSFVLRTYANGAAERKQHQKQQDSNAKLSQIGSVLAVPFVTYLGLSLLRAVDLAMTNLAMQYINYPAKTLMKSSRVVFTMIFGVFILRKKYHCIDYLIVLCMVAGLAIFMHADATSSAVFQPLGVVMLTVSLLCDGAITNMSETIMTKYGVGQDEFIFRMYSIALVAVAAAAAFAGDLRVGFAWILQPGTYDEVQRGLPPEETSWSVMGKISVIVLFSSMGLLSSSCSAAITKHFGALAMSITSTARKATTVFLSFFLFNNVCTVEHIAGVVIFITALTAKSLRRRMDSGTASSKASNSMAAAVADVELMNNQSDDWPRNNIMDRTPKAPKGPQRRPVRAPNTPQTNYVDIESQNLLEPERYHFNKRPVERGTPTVSNPRIPPISTPTPSEFAPLAENGTGRDRSKSPINDIRSFRRVNHAVANPIKRSLSETFEYHGGKRS